MRSRKTEGQPRFPYDPAIHEPVVRCSICTGEQEAGFRNRKTGEFTSVRLISSPAELAAFCRDYGVQEARKIY